jgi:hypothetical protein
MHLRDAAPPQRDQQVEAAGLVHDTSGIGDMTQSGLGRDWGVFQKPSLHLSMQA